MNGNCYYFILIEGNQSELKNGVTQIYEYLADLAKDKSFGIHKEEITEIEDVLKETDGFDKNSEKRSVEFALGHPYEFHGEEIGYENALFPAAKLMPTATMSVESEWEGPGDDHSFYLKLKNGIITVIMNDWDADWGDEARKLEITYAMKDGDWVRTEYKESYEQKFIEIID